MARSRSKLRIAAHKPHRLRHRWSAVFDPHPIRRFTHTQVMPPDPAPRRIGTCSCVQPDSPHSYQVITMNELSSPRDSRPAETAAEQTTQSEWSPPTEADVHLIRGSEENGRDYAEQIYGRLEIVESVDSANSQDVPEAPAQSREILPGPPPSGYSAWTIVVDLAANQTTRDGVTFGADNKVEQLLDLAASTEGRDITIVVQATDEDKNEIQLANGDMPNLTQYVIRDGKIYETFNGESSGTQQDLADLMETANQYAPSDHMGLIIQSHGNGVEGIRGDAGEVSLDDLTTTIDQALVAGGRAELDFINFDSCLMGNNWVLDKVEEVADFMIASPEVEASCSLEVDGQNIEEAIS